MFTWLVTMLLTSLGTSYQVTRLAVSKPTKLFNNLFQNVSADFVNLVRRI